MIPARAMVCVYSRNLVLMMGVASSEVEVLLKRLGRDLCHSDCATPRASYLDYA